MIDTHISLSKYLTKKTISYASEWVLNFSRIIHTAQPNTAIDDSAVASRKRNPQFLFFNNIY